MKRQITLTIASRDYVITLDDDGFYNALERDLGGFRNNSKILTPKELLDILVQKSFDGYEDENSMQRLIEQIDRRLKR
ncbi:hypothetical protein [Campylobacter mucosalis]|uniref:Uncharacterized protein n=1 Tax=Campylobacter mucosalis CCUG 21559 TaxID=1032067 RepID=A0A6G5QI71_9BACT|nr:hypothetical protein [Campylobacter mucosalis]KEA45534.1 hypothetical protein CR66_06785 [Campylobacter mucosalis]QCD45314.1 hypothetical protein CMUC_1564 [Campylobacter mucosalis CCUG 21559]QKF63226.1 hypothetical protein CMCT_1102 [Campylobacter mucosalis]